MSSSSSVQNSPFFIPTMINTLSLWFDAADATTITQSAGAVSQWRDKSSNAYSVLQGTSVNQPTYATNLLNGLPGIQFSGPTYLYQVGSSMPNFTSGSSTTVYMVTKNGSTMPNWNIINTVWFTSGGGNGTNRYHFSLGWTTTNGITLYTNGSAVANPSSSVVPLNTNAIIGFSASATSNYIFYNGSNTAYASSGAPPSANNTTLFLFGDNRGLNATTDQNVYEFVGFNSVLTRAQQQIVEGYLATKWGLQSSLSNGHPYKTTPLPAAPILAISPVYPTSTVLSAEFDPRVNPNCILWLDGADPLATGTAPASGTSISTWYDKSGSANHFSKVSGTTNNPTSATDGIYTITNWGNTPVFISVNTVDYTTNTMVFIVYKYTTPTFANLFGVGNGTASDFNIRVNYSSGQNVININAQDFFYLNIAGSSTSMYVNGQNYSSSTVTTRTSYNIVNGFISGSGTNTFTICSQANNRKFSGYIAEILVYQNPTSTQRQQVEAYLAKKWGLSAVLSTQNQYAPGSYLSFVNAPIMPVAPIRRAAQTSSFQPTQISGLAAWFDGADITTITLSGSSVTQWRDKSGQGNIATNTGNYPTLATQAINKRNALAFNGSQYLTFTASYLPNGSTQNSIFIVSNIGVLLQSSTAWLFSYGTSATGQKLNVSYSVGSGTNYLNIDTDTGGSSIIDTTGIGINETTITEGIFTTVNTGYRNGIPFTNNNVAITLNTGTTAGTIGATNNYGFIQYYLTGQIAEILSYNVPLGTVDRQQIEGYLAWKWGLKNSLGQGHPYFLVPPAPA
jgi:hypothetical protein